KFELDNLLSEKRITFLSNNAGFYQSYHFVPAGDINDFGLGDNQIGAELSGHSENSYTRYSIAVLSSTDGTPGLPGGRGVELQLRHRRGAAAVHARPRRRLPGDGDARRSAAPGGRAGAGMERRRAGAALHSAAAAPHRGPGGGPADVAPGRSGDPQEARRHRRFRRRVPRLSVHVQSG